MPAVLTALGRTVLVAGLASWFVGWQLGWDEFMLAAATCALLLAAAVLFTFGRMNVDVGVLMQPARVVVGQTATGQVTATNRSHRRVLGVRVELGVGRGLAHFDIPILRVGQSHDELFSVPTHRRAIIDIGPARTLRGDPLGLLRRSLNWPAVTQLYVHPLTTPLDGLGAGFLRDLEGRTTNETSTSDVELHTLRDYVPGDDRRYVHWRTSARSGKLMVRQFVDTRRSQVAVVQSGDLRDYADDDEFELGVSVLASVAVRALRDQQAVAVVAAGRALATATPRTVLDGSSGIEPGGRSAGLSESAGRLLGRNPGVTLALLVTGSVTSTPELRSAAARFGADVQVLVFRADVNGVTGVRRIGGMQILTVASLTDVPRVIRAVSQS